jgi:prepilin-type N-terminal cleavage/methylation domain-containing protein
VGKIMTPTGSHVLRKPSLTKSGFTIMEVIVTLFILASGLLILFTVFTMTVRDATTNRNWMVAELIADSILEEIQDHEYGSPMPPSWNQPQKLTAIIQGRSVVTTYERKITCLNGSFIGQTNGDYDQIEVVISWTEGSGPEGSGVTKSYREKVWVRRNHF